MIELKAPMSIKNEYVLELYDKDSRLKEKAYAYNLVTNQFFTQAFHQSAQWYPFNYMHIGTGSGTPSVSDTSLFRMLTYALTSLISVKYSYPTSTAVYKATFPASSSYVGIITEVGLAQSNGSSRLQTHALLQDSEGNPITINKTDTDTLIVTATVHCTVSAAEGLTLVPASSFIGFTRTFDKNSYNLRPSSIGLAASPAKSDQSTLGYNDYPTPNATNKSYTGTKRIDANTGNNCFVNAVYVAGFGKALLPNEAIFPPYELQPIKVGTGDGTTTEFKCPIPDFIENTEVITVDGVELTRDTDYTVDPVGNSALNASSINAHSNRAVSISYKEASYTLYAFGIRSINTNKNATFGKADAPAKFDMGIEKTCNALYIDSLVCGQSAPYGATDCVVTLEYSNDNTNWQTACSFATKFIGKDQASSLPTEYKKMLTKFDPITARYWRIYSSGTSSYLSYGLTSGGGNSFFGYVGDGIVFKEPPAEGAEIKIRAKVNRPFKTSDYLLDFSVSAYF